LEARAEEEECFETPHLSQLHLKGASPKEVDILLIRLNTKRLESLDITLPEDDARATVELFNEEAWKRPTALDPRRFLPNLLRLRYDYAVGHETLRSLVEISPILQSLEIMIEVGHWGDLDARMLLEDLITDGMPSPFTMVSHTKIARWTTLVCRRRRTNSTSLSMNDSS